MTEWLRWLPAKQLGYARASSNLAAVEKIDFPFRYFLIATKH